MNDNTATALNALAEKLGVATEHLWEVVISQAPISLFFEFLLISTLITALYLFFQYARKNKERWKKEDNEEITIVLNLILLIISLAFILFSLTFFYNLATVIFNPDYWVLETILSGR